MKFLVLYLVVFLALGWAKTPDARGVPKKLDTTKTKKQPSTPKTEPKAKLAQPGDQAQNMKVLPPWTMRQCPQGLFATYDFAGAKELKKADSACWSWQAIATLSEAQSTDFAVVVGKLKFLVKTFKDERKLDQERIQELLKQVNTEIAEKNKYKYKPDYKWLWISIGAAVAVTGIAFGAGVWVAKD